MAHRSGLTATCSVTQQAGKDPVRPATLSFSLPHVSVLLLLSETSLLPRLQHTVQVSQAVGFVQSSTSNYSFQARVPSGHRHKVVVMQLGSGKPLASQK